jgi:uncharacterized protein (TIGR01777 family)
VRVAVTGSSGLIGTALVEHLTAGGHEVVRMVRRPARGPDEVTWDPTRGELDPAALDGVDAAVNLAGAGVGDRRWTPAYKQLIRSSRLDATRTLVAALSAMPTPPRVLVSASAEGFYGDRGDEVLTEHSTGGDSFLADVVRDWEAEAHRAEDAGIRVTTARTGLVMAPQGGAFAKVLPLARLGLAGPLGSGRQWWAWITMPDEVAALTHLLTHEVSGPVNLCAPEPAHNGDVMRTLGSALHRPAWLPAPGFALRLVLGEFADDVLASIRMKPQVLQDSGFSYQHADLQDAVRWLVG